MIVARLVMAMGTKRERAAAMTASNALAPCSKRRLASSTSKMPFDTAIPTTINMPINAVIEKPCPAASNASTMPTSDTGIVNNITNGKRSDLNCEAMIMNTTITAKPIATPKPEKVSRISCTSPTKENGRARVRGSVSSLCCSSLAAVPKSRPSVCIKTCAARCS